MCKPWGVDDSANQGYRGGKIIKLNEKKPQFPLGRIFKLKLCADWKHKQCELRVYFNEKELLNPNKQICCLKLDELEEKYNWYPCVTIFNETAWTKIKYL